MGRLIERIGYSVTFSEVPREGPRIDLEVRAAPGWDTVITDRESATVQLPETVALDLGAVGKAWAADRAAQVAAQRAGCGVLVECGGDVALAGPSLLPPVGAFARRATR